MLLPRLRASWWLTVVRNMIAPLVAGALPLHSSVAAVVPDAFFTPAYGTNSNYSFVFYNVLHHLLDSSRRWLWERMTTPREMTSSPLVTLQSPSTTPT